MAEATYSQVLTLQCLDRADSGLCTRLWTHETEPYHSQLFVYTKTLARASEAAKYVHLHNTESEGTLQIICVHVYVKHYITRTHTNQNPSLLRMR